MEELQARWASLQAEVDAMAAAHTRICGLVTLRRDVDDAEAQCHESEAFTATAQSGTVGSELAQLCERQSTWCEALAAHRAKIEAAAAAVEPMPADEREAAGLGAARVVATQALVCEVQTKATSRLMGLQEAVREQSFLRTATELALWIEEKMAAASGGDHGSDLMGSQQLRGLHTTLASEVAAGRVQVAALADQAQALVASYGALASSLPTDRAAELQEAFAALKKQVEVRATQLEASERGHQFLHDAMVYMDWIDEEETLLADAAGPLAEGDVDLLKGKLGLVGERMGPRRIGITELVVASESLDAAAADLAVGPMVKKQRARLVACMEGLEECIAECTTLMGTARRGSAFCRTSRT